MFKHFDSPCHFIFRSVRSSSIPDDSSQIKKNNSGLSNIFPDLLFFDSNSKKISSCFHVGIWISTILYLGVFRFKWHAVDDSCRGRT